MQSRLKKRSISNTINLKNEVAALGCASVKTVVEMAHKLTSIRYIYADCVFGRWRWAWDLKNSVKAD